MRHDLNEDHPRSSSMRTISDRNCFGRSRTTLDVMISDEGEKVKSVGETQEQEQAED